MDETVSLKEHLQQQIRHERELRTAAEIQTALALTKQAAEYERQLESLRTVHRLAMNRVWTLLIGLALALTATGLGWIKVISRG